MALAAAKTSKSLAASCGKETCRIVRVFNVVLSCILECFYQHLFDNLLRYFTVTRMPSLCEVNSGAYMHWMVVRPLL